jgi:hypothetical protein
VKAAIDEAARLFENASLDRCQFVEGNFFDWVPEAGNAYVLSRILHDWHDNQAVQILKVIRRAMTNTSTLLIVERVLHAENPSIEASHSDLHMLVMTGGRERTAAEYQTLLAAAEFELVRVIPTGSPLHIVEATSG